MLFNKKANKQGLVLGAILLLSALFCFFTINIGQTAWTGPTDDPPNDNIPRPLNRSTEFVGDNGFILGTESFDIDNNILNLRVLGCGDDEILISSSTGSWECSSSTGDLLNSFECEDGQLLVYNYEDSIWECGYINESTTNTPDLLAVLNRGADASAFIGGVNIGDLSIEEGWMDVGGPLTTNWLHATSTSGVSTFAHDVGIGTDSPDQKLDVAGNVQIDQASAYMQDGQQVIKIDKGTDAFYANLYAGAGAGSEIQRQIALGYRAGDQSTGAYQTALGYYAGYSNTGNFQTTVGYYSGYLNTGPSQTALGYWSGYKNEGIHQTVLGYLSGYLNTGNYQTALGYVAGSRNSGIYQTALGSYAGYQNTGAGQTVLGHNAGYQNAGSSQTALGYNSGRGNSAVGQTAIGYYAGYNTSNTASTYQTAIGYRAGYQNNGAYQTAIGYRAGEGNSGNNVVAIGYQAGYGNTLNNQFIVASVYPTPLIQGNFSTGNVGIGTTTPSAKLTVAGQVQITGGDPGVGKVLTSDINGLAFWASSTGSTGSLPVGTNNQTLRYSTGTNSWEANSNLVNTGARVGIGTTDPQMSLEVGSPIYNNPAYIRLHSDANNNSGISFSQAGVPQWWIWRERTENNNLIFGYGDVTAVRVMTLTKDTGNVGIGTSNPNRALHIASTTGNSEIDIQSGSNSHWGIYQDIGEGVLRFWNNSDTLELRGSDSEANTEVDVKGKLCLGGICKSSWGSVYVGNTVSTDNGNQGGYSVVDDLCIDGAHVCSNEEIIKSMRDGVSMSGSAWVNSGAGGSSNDCRGWTSSSSSDFGAVWDLSSKISWVVPCSASLNFACCK